MLILSVDQAQLINQGQPVTLYSQDKKRYPCHINIKIKQRSLFLKKTAFCAYNLGRTQRAHLTNLITCLFLTSFLTRETLS